MARMRSRLWRRAGGAPCHSAALSTTASALRSCRGGCQGAAGEQSGGGRTAATRLPLQPLGSSHRALPWGRPLAATGGAAAGGPPLTRPSASSCLRRSIILRPRLLYSLAICCAKAARQADGGGAGAGPGVAAAHRLLVLHAHQPQPQPQQGRHPPVWSSWRRRRHAAGAGWARREGAPVGSPASGEMPSRSAS